MRKILQRKLQQKREKERLIIFKNKKASDKQVDPCARLNVKQLKKGDKHFLKY